MCSLIAGDDVRWLTTAVLVALWSGINAVFWDVVLPDLMLYCCTVIKA